MSYIAQSDVQVCVFAGIPIKSTLDNPTTIQYTGLISGLTDKARSVVRDLDPTNDLTFLRVRSKKHEIMIAPGQ
ncbi:Dynein light chain roadblock-type 2 [Portunus trituberculatus]|uniref:Dynein light chain roadblock-type 2 n=1 Tax=Portunus trituberculatus TaxID=210409 RepID=A0A5B7K6W9_PORTR|nr:Dynein light chain roadblock-type 2 [Portunus trituberculatus]